MNKRIAISALIIALAFVTAAVHAEDACTSACVGLPASEIVAFPEPNVRQIYADDALLYDRSYQRVLEAVDIHDAPNGNVVETLDAGFNYITAQGSVEGWTQINADQWVLTEKLKAALPSTYAGVLLPAEMPYPIAWILVNVVPSREPGAEPPEDVLPLMRYTVVNIYATVEVDGWNWYQIGVDQWVEQRLIAKMLPVPRPAEVDTERWISVDLYEQVVIAYENETPVFTTLVSSGLAEWPTNEGLFHVYVRFPRTIMSGAEGQPDFYYLEEVPWTMYFDHDIGLHGTYWHDGFGYRHSHGCVNLSITDAHWLYNWASPEIDLTVPGDTGAAVLVYSSGEYR